MEGCKQFLSSSWCIQLQSFDFSVGLEHKAFDTEGNLLTTGPPGSLFCVKRSSIRLNGTAENNMRVHEISEVVE
jgi:hypothetical protein